MYIYLCICICTHTHSIHMHMMYTRVNSAFCMYLLLGAVGLGTYHSSKTDQVDEVTDGLPAMISRGYQCRVECGTGATYAGVRGDFRRNYEGSFDVSRKYADDCE